MNGGVCANGHPRSENWDAKLDLCRACQDRLSMFSSKQKSDAVRRHRLRHVARNFQSSTCPLCDAPPAVLNGSREKILDEIMWLIDKAAMRKQKA